MSGVRMALLLFIIGWSSILKAQSPPPIVDVWVPGQQRLYRLPVGIQMRAVGEDTQGLRLSDSGAGMLAPIFQLDRFLPLTRLGGIVSGQRQMFQPDGGFFEGYGAWARYLSPRMVIVAMDGFSFDASPVPFHRQWASYFASRPTEFGRRSSDYMLLHYFLIDRVLADGRRKLVNARDGSVQLFSMVIPMARPNAQILAQRASLNQVRQRQGEQAFAKALIGLAVTIFVGETIGSLARPIGAQFAEANAECQRARAAGQLALYGCW